MKKKIVKKIDNTVDSQTVFEHVREIHKNEDDFHEGNIEERVMACDSYQEETISLSKLDPNEWGSSECTVQEYASLPSKTSPRIVIHKYSHGSISIVDGMHRVKAAFKRGDKTIDAYVGNNPVFKKNDD